MQKQARGQISSLYEPITRREITLPPAYSSERLTGALPDLLTHHVHILEMNGDSYRLKRSRENAVSQASEEPDDA